MPHTPPTHATADTHNNGPTATVSLPTASLPAPLRPYPAYKPSGSAWIGNVPEHWGVQPFFAAFTPRRDRNLGMKEKVVLSLSYGRIVVKPLEKLHGLVPESFETYQIVDLGDVVLRTTDLQNDHTSLRVGFVQNRGIITSAYLALKSQNVLVPRYGFFFLSAWDTSKAIYGYGSGLRQNLDFVHLKRMPVVLPPTEEQAAIVRYLDDACGRLDRAIRAKRKMLALLHEQKQAIIHRAVTQGLDPLAPKKDSGIPWLGQIPAHWEVVPMISIAEVIDPNPSHRNPFYVEKGFPFISTVEFIGTDEILRETSRRVAESTVLEQEKRCRFTDSSIAFSRKGTIGSVRFLPSDYRFALLDSLCVINCKPSTKPRYLYHQLRSHAITAQLDMLSRGAALKQISVGKVRALKVLHPPSSEQLELSEFIDGVLPPINRQISCLIEQVALLQEYRVRLVSDVVTGKLDVREAAKSLPERGSWVLEEAEDGEEEGGEIFGDGVESTEEGED